MSELKTIAMSLAIFAALLTGMLNFSGAMFNQYGSNIVNTTQYSSVNDTRGDLQGTRQTYTGNAKNQSEQVDQDIEQDTFFISSIAEGVTNIYTAGSGIISAVQTLGNQVAIIPPFLPTLIVALLLIAMIWGIFQFTFS